jgi:predicted Zn finger-like uncharacterized protein
VAEDLIPIEDCPECGTTLEVPDEQIGTKVECPDCGKRFTAKEARKRSRQDDYDDDYDDEEEDRPRKKKRRGASRQALQDAASKKLTAGICGILLGGFGVHKFILGFPVAGVIMIVLTFVTCGMAGFIGLIEGIIYLTKSDEDFYQTYIVGKKEWF